MLSFQVINNFQTLELNAEEKNAEQKMKIKPTLNVKATLNVNYSCALSKIIFILNVLQKMGVFFSECADFLGSKNNFKFTKFKNMFFKTRRRAHV